MKIKNKFVSIWVILSCIILLRAQNVTFTEVMYDPATNEYYDEFIEIANTGDSPFSLRHTGLEENLYLIVNGEKEEIISPDSNYVLESGQKAVILDNGYLIEGESDTYEDMIPDSVLLLTVGGAAFGSGGLNNEDPNEMLLVTPLRDTISRYTTTPDQEEGYSDEKIILSGDNSEDNWGNSQSKKGTPGLKNSITPLRKDIRVDSIETSLNNEGQIEVLAEIENIGREIIDDAEFICGKDDNQDGKLQEGEIDTRESVSLNAGDSISKQVLIKDINSGSNLIIAEVIAPSDLDKSNNLKQKEIFLPYTQGSIAINEIMYYPESSFEWIELYNTTESNINLQGWKVGDEVKSVKIFQKFILRPKEYVCVVSDSSFLSQRVNEPRILALKKSLPALNNTSDSVKVVDPTNNVVDSTKYDNTWGYKEGVSLERRNPFINSCSQGNWGLSTAPEGSTPGKENSILVKEKDLSIEKDIKILEEDYFQGDTISLVFRIENIGLNSIAGFQVQAKYHQDQDSLDKSEPFFKKDYTLSLASQESIADTVEWRVTKGGAGFIKVNINNEQDQNHDNNTEIEKIKAGFPENDVLINEIMYNPNSGDPEWFEIINNSDKKINLAEWMFKDSQNSLNTITEKTKFIEQDSLLVVAENSSVLNQYSDLYEQDVLIAETFSILNNDKDSVVIIDPNGNYIDGLQYKSNWGKDKGRSLERRSTKRSSNRADNWGLAKAEVGATPARANSISMKNYDLTIDSTWVGPETILEGDTVQINMRIKNAGVRTVENYEVLTNIYDQDSSKGSVKEGKIEINKNLESGEAVKNKINLSGLSGGVYSYTVNIINDKDQKIDNNVSTGEIYIGYNEGSVVINEIMYNPAQGEAEWIELYNTTDKEINLQEWTMTDAIMKWKKITDSSKIIEPQDYIVIASSSEFDQTYPSFEDEYINMADFPTLNNSSDQIILRDGAGHRIEDVTYKSQWGGRENISLERRNPYAKAKEKNDWGSSQSSIGATPGKENSILKYDYDLAIINEEVGFEKRQVESGQMLRFNLKVQNRGIKNSTQFDIVLYRDENNDSVGQKYEEVWKLRNVPSLEADSIRDIEGRIFSSNPGHNTYICKIEAERDYNPHNNKVYDYTEVAFPKRSLVINEFLADPGEDQVEYIELYNRTEGKININKWKLSNNWTEWKISNDYMIPPGEYFILSKDSTILNYFDIDEDKSVVSDGFPGLNNIEDSLSLVDLTGKVIDSVFYTEDWDIEKGLAYEKNLPESPSNDFASWDVAEEKKGGTPGEFNSVSPLKYDLAIDTLLYTNQGDTGDTFSLFFYCSNQGREKSESTSLQIKDGSGKVIEETTIPEMEPGEQKEIPIEVGPFPRGTHFYKGEINWNKDLNDENDDDIFKIYVSFLKGELVISEFMPIPYETRKEGQSVAEYIEIYNFTKQDVNLSDWSVTDANTANEYSIPVGTTIEGKDFMALADDSSIVNYSTVNNNNFAVLSRFPNLNNDEDLILLKDPRGKIIDSLSYFSGWNFEKGIAQEKVYLEKPNLSNNWRLSTVEEGGTPGYKNSVKVENLAKKPGLRAEPEAFSPDGDGKDDKIGFYYRLSFNSANVTVTIYDLKGRLIAKPADNKYSSSEGVVHWEGDTKQGGKARVGRYIARIKAVDSETKDKEGYVTTFVVSKRSN